MIQRQRRIMSHEISFERIHQNTFMDQFVKRQQTLSRRCLLFHTFPTANGRMTG